MTTNCQSLFESEPAVRGSEEPSGSRGEGSIPQSRRSASNSIVMVFGTFDGLHPGHADFFRQAHALGNYVVAVVAQDISVEKIKGRSPHFSADIRQQKLKATGWVDEVRLGSKKNKLAIVEKAQPDIIALGFDQTTFSEEELDKKLAAQGLKIKIIRLKPFHPEIYKSSKLLSGKLVSSKR